MNSPVEVPLCDERKANKPDSSNEGSFGGGFFGWVFLCVSGFGFFFLFTGWFLCFAFFFLGYLKIKISTVITPKLLLHLLFLPPLQYHYSNTQYHIQAIFIVSNSLHWWLLGKDIPLF